MTKQREGKTLVQPLLKTRAGRTVVENIRNILVQAAPRAAEFDENRIISEDVFAALEDAGVPKSLIPKAFGGLELSLCDVNRILFDGGRSSGSLGWTMMAQIHSAVALGRNPPQTVHKKLDNHPKLRTRGVASPKGKAVPVEGGFMISGRWAFASGGPSPHYLSGNCIVFENGVPRIGAEGLPEMRMVMMPISDVKFHDTWQVLGMRGTDSCDFSAHEVFVPEAMTSDLFATNGCFDNPAGRLPTRVVFSMGHAAVALGIAQGALDEIIELSKTKRATMNPTALLANDPLFRHYIGENELRLAAACSLLDRVTDESEQTASERTLEPYEIMMARAMTALITSECVAVVDSAYSLGGSASLYDASPLQRRLRDIHVVTQHIAASKEMYRTLGAILLGVELPAVELLI